MRIKLLKINNLRNIAAAEIEPHPDFNIIHGANGAGKTTVLEALVILAKGRSFRSGNAPVLTGPKQDYFRLVARLSRADERERTIGLERSARQWRARVDGADVQQLSELAPHLPLVLLEPNSHQLVSGAPEGRRKYLDWAVFHVKHDYLDNWRRYTRSLKQRNAALRSRQLPVVASLEPLLLELGGGIDAARIGALDELSPVFSRTLEQLSPDLRGISLSYQPGYSGETFEESLAVSLERDLERGSTGSGPHRADIRIRQEGRAARDRLSRGEQKIVAAALVLAQARVLAHAGARPLLLFDDLASEFDRQHLENVTACAATLGSQTWVTGTDAEPYLGRSSGDHALFHVKQGAIRPA